MNRVLIAFGFCLLATVVACAQENNEAKLQKEISGVLGQYYASVKQGDADKAISYYLHSPDFLIYSNGKMYTYDGFTAAVKVFLPSVRQMDVTFDTLFVRKVDDVSAFATGPFHEKLTDANGKVSVFDILATFLLRKINNEWKIAYATSLYQPAASK